jgi:hypothetical protein
MAIEGPAGAAQLACEYLASEMAKSGARSTACVPPGKR